MSTNTKQTCIAVYAIVDHDTNQYYIGRTYRHRLYKCYAEHVAGRIRKTANMFATAKAESRLPAMYDLHTDSGSMEEAFRWCVAWTRYFEDHAFQQATSDILVTYAEDMLSETKALYDQIGHLPYDEVLLPEGGLFPHFRKQRPKKSSCTQLSIRFSPEEYHKVKHCAEAENYSITAYCKQQSLAGRVIHVDFTPVTAWLDSFRETKDLLRMILLAIYRTGNYYPADLKNIQEGIDQLSDLYGETLRLLTELIHEIRLDGSV